MAGGAAGVEHGLDEQVVLEDAPRLASSSMASSWSSMATLATPSSTRAGNVVSFR